MRPGAENKKHINSKGCWNNFLRVSISWFSRRIQIEPKHWELRSDLEFKKHLLPAERFLALFPSSLLGKKRKPSSQSCCGNLMRYPMQSAWHTAWHIKSTQWTLAIAKIICNTPFFKSLWQIFYQILFMEIICFCQPNFYLPFISYLSFDNILVNVNSH